MVGNLGRITLIGLSPMYYFLINLSLFISVIPLSLPPPNADESCDREEHYLLPWKHGSALFLPHFCFCRVSCIGCNGIWLVWCHLQPLALECQIVLLLLLLPHNGSLYLRITEYTIYIGFLLRLLFCNVFNHYFCDLFPLLELSCSSIYVNELSVIFFSVFNILTPALAILASYIFIISSILHICSTEGKTKAFSTCSSHISTVAVFYGSTASMYLKLSSVSSMDQGKVSSVFYSIIVPMINPLVYSLQNRDIKFALKKIVGSRKCRWIETT